MQREQRFDGVPLVLGVVVGLLLSLVQWSGVVLWFDFAVFDVWARLGADDARPSPFVRLVEIDDRSLGGAASEELELGSWPWNRKHWAVLQHYVLNDPDYRPSVCVYDIVFDLPNEGKESGDYLFAQQVEAAGNVLLACQFLNPVPESALTDGETPTRASSGTAAEDLESFRRFALSRVDSRRGDPQSATALGLPLRYTWPLESGGEVRNVTIDLIGTPAGVGFTSIPRDSDGVARRFPLVMKFDGLHYPSLPLLAAAMWLGAGVDDIEVVYGSHVAVHAPDGRTYRVPVDRHGALLVEFRTTAWRQAYGSSSFVDVLSALGERIEGATPSVDLEQLKDRIVLVGATASSSTDLHPVPVAAQYPGVCVLADVIECILEQRAMRDAGPWAAVAAVVLLSLLGAGIVQTRLAPATAIAIVLALAALYVFGSYLGHFFARLHVPVVVPVLAGLASATGTVVYRHLLVERQRAMIESIFGRVVSRDVVSELLSNPEMLTLGGSVREVGILFTDIKSYTAISGGMRAPDVVAMLNDYFSEMMKIVLANEGTLDKYMGDGMMVIFGAPKVYQDRSEAAYLAVRCGMQMQRRMAELRELWAGTDHPELHIRIGIEFGEAVVGLIGSEELRQYTAIGSNVNLASRLESNAPPDGVLISESVYNLVSDRVKAEKMPPIQVKNVAEPVQTYLIRQE